MKVLFVGNSHTYFNDMPCMVREILRSAGIPTEVVMLTRGGECLKNHGQSEQVRFNLLYGGYDVVVLQEVESSFPGEEEYIKSLYPLVELARRAGTKPVLYMNFAPEGDAERQNMLSAACRKAAEVYHAAAAPAGDAFFEVQRTNPEIDLYFTDRRHASVQGSYLAALCLAKAAAGADPMKAPEHIETMDVVVADLSEAEASVLKAAAEQVTC